MKKLIIALMLSTASVSWAGTPKELVGTWVAESAPDRGLKGLIILEASGKATLKPETQPTLEGTWATEGKELKLTMPPHGTAVMNWVLSPKSKLTLTYDNGSKQIFNKQKVKK